MPIIKLNKSNVQVATFFSQLAMLANVSVGLLILPFILYKFGSNSLSLYIQIFAAKAVIEIFTSALGGSFIREMLRADVSQVFKVSRYTFLIYSFLSILIFFFVNLKIELLDGKGFILFSILVFCSLYQQPYHQRLSALKYQHVPAIVRLVFNLVLLVSILLVGVLHPAPSFDLVLVCLATSATISLFLSLFLSIPPSRTNYEPDKFLLLPFLRGSLVGYGAFASFLALCFQVEILLLEHFIGQALFLIVIVAWKVPNMIVQFIWRYAEVNGLHEQSKSKNSGILSKEFRQVERNTLLISSGVGILYFYFSPWAYSIWMGGEFSNAIPVEQRLVFAIGIVILSMNRVYTSLIQYRSGVNTLAIQYGFIIGIKLLSIAFISTYFYLASFVVWFTIEMMFIFSNKSRLNNV